MAVPEQIRRQSEAVAKFYEGKDTEQKDEVKSEADGVAPEETKPADSVEDDAPAPVLNEQKPTGNKDNEETYEKRYKTLQGMYNADTVRLRTENQQLNQRLTQMEQLFSTLSASPAPAATADRKLITDKDVEEYGDSIEVMRRVSEESLTARDNKIADMEKMLKRMESIYDRFDRKWGDEMDANHVRIPGDLFCNLFFEMQDMVEYFRWIQKQKGIPQFNYNSVEEVEQ